MEQSPRFWKRQDKARWQNYLRPRPRPSVESRRRRFDGIVEFLSGRTDGWLISVRGAPQATIEVLPDSDIPEILEANGLRLHEVPGPHRRMVPHATTEILIDPVTKRESRRVTHAGLITTRQFSFSVD